MGCMCSKGVSPKEYSHKHPKKSSKRWFTSSRRNDVVVDVDNCNNGATTLLIPDPNEETIPSSGQTLWDDGDKKDVASEKSDMQLIQRPEKIIDGNGGVHVHQPGTYKIYSIRYGVDELQAAGGWPPWLTSVAGEAIKGLLPRKAESFQKMDKIGQGTYSSVYRARDLETGKIVALKKVRFINRDPESVRFMAREINVLRKLDHPNVMKLEGLVTSRMSDNLYLVFEYMEHDLAGLAACPTIELTESQIKCYMQQLLRGLEHCHNRGVLHRDIKGSNLLIDNNGNLKIGDFGLATPFSNNNNKNNNKQPLTSRVVTLWYRPPELLLGATDYGVGVDLWSAGCILAELFAGKPIMPGRTEVEQMHKIFKLCGSPCEEYWRKSKLPHATIFKPKHPYERCLGEIFKDLPPSALKLLDSLLAVEPNNRGSASSALRSEYFTTKPLPCDPSNLPKYPPSKEYDIKLRNDEKRRNKSGSTKTRGSESSRKDTRQPRPFPAPHSNQLKHQNPQTTNETSNFPTNPVNNRHFMQHNTSESQIGYKHHSGTTRSTSHGKYHQLNNAESSHHIIDRPNLSSKKRDNAPGKGYAPKKNRIHYSGPLLPPGGNMEEMLKEHEKHIQHAVRRARFDNKYSKRGFDENFENCQRELLLQQMGEV
ncbi:hypothetical protein L2E82_24679 [Cichorium intybus]|uniref:Uncharacterized protein n=1 Tax=Cichorium intybus TaxID=13427 RepID=A0ACB9E152_CICIN|nr:hypothetical protein L2E82_24679 [Cichorium intybus]